MTSKFRVGLVDEFESGTPRQVEIEDTKIAVIRIDDDFYALDDRCSHANYSLAEGEVDCHERTVECWRHGALFSLADGTALTLPATKGVTPYEIEVDEGAVFVSLPRSKR